MPALAAGSAVAGVEQEAVEKCMLLKPDRLVLDMCMPKLNGLDAARLILNGNPAQRILILTEAESEKVVRLCSLAGVRGCICKTDGTDDLTTAVETLQRQSGNFTLRVSDLPGGHSKYDSADPTAALWRCWATCLRLWLRTKVFEGPEPI